MESGGCASACGSEKIRLPDNSVCGCACEEGGGVLVPHHAMVVTVSYPKGTLKDKVRLM